MIRQHEHKAMLPELPLTLLSECWLRQIHGGWVLASFDWHVRHEADGTRNFSVHLGYCRASELLAPGEGGNGRISEGIRTLARTKAPAADRLELIRLGLVPQSILRGTSDG